MAIHVAVIRRVRPGREAEFQEALRKFFRDSFDNENVLGAGMIVPPPGDDSREYGILRSFASAAQRDAFYASPIFREWDKRARELTDGEPQKRELTGLEAWFRNPEGPQPPVWKMALLTFIAVWPVSMLVPAIVLPFISPVLHPILAPGVIALGIVLILTWVAMPLLTKLTRRWLQP
jgi:antibiotic biosynthesis monooxygenase (ABM) superfamily enzyme